LPTAANDTAWTSTRVQIGKLLAATATEPATMEWTDLPGTLSGAGEGWYTRTIDLAAYQNETVQLRFEVEFAEGSYGSGRYAGQLVFAIDDVKYGTTLTKVDLAADDFDDEVSKWSVSGGSWKFGLPADVSTEDADPVSYGKGSFACTVLNGLYQRGTDATLETPWVEIDEDAENVELTFASAQRLGAAANGSKRHILIREEGGEWTDLEFTFVDGNAEVAAGDQTWYDLAVSVPDDYQGKTVQFGFHFEGPKNTDQARGWCIDEVGLTNE
jgi:hypothetical protein